MSPLFFRPNTHQHSYQTATPKLQCGLGVPKRSDQ